MSNIASRYAIVLCCGKEKCSRSKFISLNGSSKISLRRKYKIMKDSNKVSDEIKKNSHFYRVYDPFFYKSLHQPLLQKPIIHSVSSGPKGSQENTVYASNMLKDKEGTANPTNQTDQTYESSKEESNINYLDQNDNQIKASETTPYGFYCH
jgi:hypothetical protein